MKLNIPETRKSPIVNLFFTNSYSKTNLWTERASQDHKIVVVVVVAAAAVVGNMAALQIEAVASAIEAGVEAVEAAAEAVVAAAAAVGNAPS